MKKWVIFVNRAERFFRRWLSAVAQLYSPSFLRPLYYTMDKQEFYQECCLRAMTVFLSDADSKDKTPEEVADIVTSFAGALADAVFPEREFSVTARGMDDYSDESSPSLLSACLTHFEFDMEHHLPVRVANVLCGQGITTLRKLIDADPDELRQIRGLGEHSLKQIREFLDSF